MSYKAIAIVGNDEAGKSTIASVIKELYIDRDLNIQRGSFASTVKDDLQKLGIDMFRKPYSNSKRDLVRAYAETCKEEFGEDYWVSRTISTFTKKINIVLDDMRFNIELNTWQQTYQDHAIIVLVNNIPMYDYNSHESVIQVNDIIHKAKQGKIPNSLLINNIHTTNGVLPIVKQQLEEYLLGTLINKASEDL